MFRILAHASLKRSVHTSARRAASARPTGLQVVLGASAVATSYFAWNMWYGQRIALDAAPKRVPPKPKTSTSPDAAAPSDSTAFEHEPSIAHEPSISHDSPPPFEADETKVEPTVEGEGVEEGEQGSSGGGGGGAFNPETGEINWDCPCLGGMAHGPCGMQFREAFSCFVFSEADPKGIDCVEKFKAMQTCFREHPDVYGDDIMNDDDDEEELGLDAVPSPETAPTPEQQPVPLAASEPSEPSPSNPEQKSKPKKATSSQ